MQVEKEGNNSEKFCCGVNQFLNRMRYLQNALPYHVFRDQFHIL
ncbi:hypothetical protein Q7O_003842 [Pectobacterium carotovorum subsp. carotovorum PCCS1]|nr:hypothetical protein [Pectobacterium carotovorum subsp. carotovorum PCCS1]